MSDIVERLLRRADDSDNQELDREVAAELERLRKLVRSAYNEGFNEGMNECQRYWSGGKSWDESRSRRALDGEEKMG